jgi:DNA-binding CsgD family transcriptional regulator
MTTAGPGHDLPLRGRDQERALLGAAIAAGRERGTVALVLGAAGIGKTRLLDEAVAIAGRAGFGAVRGATQPDEQILPVAPLLDALGPDPELDALALGGDRDALLAALEQRLEARALEAPLLVVIDDLQWADPPTLDALRVLTAALADVPVAWILACRPPSGEPSAVALTALMEDLTASGAVPCALGALDDAAVAAVVGDVAGAPPDAALQALAARAHGQPFALVELLVGLVEDGVLRVQDGVAHADRHELPARVRESMRERLARLPPLARSTAGVAAVLGRTTTLPLLSTMLEVDPDAVRDAAGALAAAGLIRRDGDTVAFDHDLVREAVLGTLPGSALGALRRQAADVLLAAGATPLSVAPLLTAAARPGDHAAAATLLDAGRALGATDAPTAADLLLHAFGLTERGDPLRGALIAETALHLHTADRAEEGRAFADAYLEELAPVEQARVLEQVANMYILSASVRIAASRRALELLEDLIATDPAAAASAAVHRALMAGNLVGAGWFAAADAEMLAAEQAAAALPADPAVQGAMTVARLFHAMPNARYRELVASGLALGDASGPLGKLQTTVGYHGLGEVDAAVAIMEPALAAAREAGELWAVRMCEETLGVALTIGGRLEEALALLEGLVTAGPSRLLRNVSEASAAAAVAQAALWRSDTRLSAQCAALAEAGLQADTPEVRRHCAWILAQQAFVTEGAERGRAVLLKALGDDRAETALPRFPRAPHDPVILARLAAGADDPELAAEALRTAREAAQRNPGARFLAGLAAHAEALVLPAAGDPDGARRTALLETAVAELTAHGQCAHRLGSAQEDLAQLRDGEKAVALLMASLDAYMSCGAEWHAARVRGRLREHGVRLGGSAERDRPLDGWDSLTEAERRVVGLVNEGLTNRQAAERLFVSPHTVSTHLRHVFVKLGVSSRRELLARSLQAGG